jgi:hypothetical protein
MLGVLNPITPKLCALADIIAKDDEDIWLFGLGSLISLRHRKYPLSVTNKNDPLTSCLQVA